MKYHKKVSICIPTYQHGKYLSLAIDSALNQTMPAYEVMVSNDCSTDNTDSVLKKYEGLVTIINHKKNIGMINNYRFLIESARGDYIVLLSDDDALHPNFLKKVVPFCDRYDMVATARFSCDQDMQPFDVNGLTFIKHRHLPPDKGFYVFLNNLNYSISGSIWNRHWLLTLPKLTQEAELSFDWYAAIVTGAFRPMALLPTPLLYYRFHDNNFAGNKVRMVKSSKAMFYFLSTLDQLDSKKRVLARDKANNYEIFYSNIHKLSQKRLTSVKNTVRSLLPYVFKHPKYIVNK